MMAGSSYSYRSLKEEFGRLRGTLNLVVSHGGPRQIRVRRGQGSLQAGVRASLSNTWDS